jgi:hypothetical protein
MFKAGLEFALGLGAGCVLLYAIFLGASFVWFEIDQRLFERSRQRLSGPALVRAESSTGPSQPSPVEKAPSRDTGVSAR